MAVLIFKQGNYTETGSLAYAEPIFFTDANTLIISGGVSTYANTEVSPQITAGRVDYRVATMDSINTGSFIVTSDVSASNLLLDGNATIRGNITMGGSGLDFGDASDDNVVFKADISSSILPNNDDSFDLGSDSQRWKTGYLSNLNLSGSLFVDGGPIDLHSDTYISASSGTFTHLDVGSYLDIDVTGNTTFDGQGTLSVSSSGALKVDSPTSIGIGTNSDAPIDIDSTTLDIDSSGAITVDSTSTISLDGVGNSNFTIDSGNLTINNTTSGNMTLQSAGAIDIDADGGKITIDGSSGIDIGVESDVAIDIDSSTLDVDASGAITISGSGVFDVNAAGALTLDSDTSISIGTDHDKPIDIDSSTLDIDASGAITIDGTSTLSIDVDGATNINTSVGGIEINSEAGSLTLDGHTGVDIDASNSGKVSIDGAGGIDIGVAADVAIDVDSSTLDIDASGNITINGEGSTAISSSGALSIDSETGINIGTTTDKPIDIDASTFDVDASGALTIDSATSIGIGTNADKPIDIDSTTLDIDSSGAITINGESTTAISSSGALSIDSETSINIGTTSDKPVNIDSTTFDVDSTDGIRLKSNNGISLEESGVVAINVDANQDVSFPQEGGSKTDPDVDIVGYLKLGQHGGFIQGALSSSGEISSSADITTSGLNAGNINVGITGDNEIDTDSGNLTIDSAGGTVTIDDNIIITGDLTVNGTRTFTNTTTLDVADNIININYGGSSVYAGIYANDTTAPNVLSGSILWDGTNDRWIAGQSGSEQTILLNNGDSIVSGSGTNNQITTFTGTHGVDSSANLTFDGSTLRVTGTQEITSHLSGSASASFADLKISDDASIASLTVTDLTSGRIVLVGGGGEIEDSSKLTFDGSDLTVVDRFSTSNSEGGSLFVGSSNSVFSEQGINFKDSDTTIQNTSDGGDIVLKTTNNASSTNTHLTLFGPDLSSTFAGSVTATSFTGSIASTNGVVSGSSQVDYSGLSGINNDIVSASTDSSRVNFTITDGNITADLIGGVVTGSSQIDYSALSGINNNIISASSDTSQVDMVINGGSISANLKGGVVSGSSQLSGDFLSKLGDSVISSSAQVNANTITNFDSNVKAKLDNDGVISGSSQVSLAFSDITSKPSYLVSNLIPGNNVTITSGSDTLKIEASAGGGGGGTISGSSQVDHDATTNFVVGEHFLQSAITTVGTVTTGNVQTILPSGVTSGSSQISGLGFITGSDATSPPNWIASDLVAGTNVTITSGSNTLTINSSAAGGGANDATITLTPGSGLDGGGAFTVNQSGNEEITFTVGDGVVSGSAQIDGSALGSNKTIEIGGTSVTLGGSITDETLFGGTGVVSGSAGVSKTLQNVTDAGASTNVATTFSNTTDSTSKTTGALIVGGGLGVNNTINAGGDVIAFASSDERLKDNIKPIENPLEKLSQISGNTFDWNQEKQNIYNGKDYGVIAQEIEKVMPELVDTRDNGYLAVKYDKIVPLLIESIKELKKEIEELKSK